LFNWFNLFRRYGSPTQPIKPMKLIQLIKLLNRCIFDQIPHPAGTGSSTKAASDAQVLINPIFVSTIAQIFSTDRGLRADGSTYATVPAGAAG
jgi:hypothetical protein